MSKLWKLIAKNFKIIFRSRISSLIIILGPLFVMLFAGFAFDNDAQFELSLGVHVQDDSDLTQRFIDSLGAKFTIIEYENKNTCVDDVRDLNTHSCLVFPENFEVAEKNANLIEIYVDNSKVNIVDLIQNALNGVILVETSQISEDLTQILLTSINDVSNKLDTWDDTLQTHVLPTQKELSDNIFTDTQKLKGLDLEYTSYDHTLNNLQNAEVYLDDAISDLSSQVESAVNGLENVALDIMQDNESTSSLRSLARDADDLSRELSSDLERTTNTSDAYLAILEDSIVETMDLVFQLQSAVSETEKLKGDLTENFREYDSKLNLINIKLSGVSSELNLMNTRLKNIRIKNADNIVSPVTSTIVPVVVETSKLHFVFPSLMMLVIMFVCLMLGATMVVVEKLTPARFRIFTTPTADWVFIMSIFMTIIFVALIQITIILLLAHFVFALPVFANFFPTVIVLLLGAVMFALIGMAVGYMFNNEQTTILGAISIGSAFILVSDLILPIESVSEGLRNVMVYTPFLLLTSLLRRTIIFDASFMQVYKSLGLITLYCVVLLGVIILVHKLLRVWSVYSTTKKFK